jgi:hypothetical protein
VATRTCGSGPPGAGFQRGELAPADLRKDAALLDLGSLGNLRTQTARAFDAAEMQKILGLLPR